MKPPAPLEESDVEREGDLNEEEDKILDLGNLERVCCRLGKERSSEVSTVAKKVRNSVEKRRTFNLDLSSAVLRPPPDSSLWMVESKTNACRN